MLSNSLTWSDTRSHQEAHALRQCPQASEIIQRTGCPIDAAYPLAKIKWLKDNLTLPPEARFVSIKEYVLQRLTGQYLADWAIASATGMFDIRLHRWDPEATALLGISAENLSSLVSPRTVLETWSQEARDLADIPPGTPLVIGGGDGQLASLGVGAATSDALAVNVGTSAAARALIRQPAVDPGGRLWTYVADEQLWAIGGMVSSGGIVFEWFLNNFFTPPDATRGEAISPEIYASVDRIASQAPPGAEGLLFIPYLSGAQAPDWLPNTRGSFSGIALTHQRGHFARAVLEGITRSIYRIAESIESVLDRHFEEIYVTGGLTASAVWLQIAADMFGAVVAVPETSEGSARGAAMLAMIALGMKSDLRDFQGLFTPRQRVYPDDKAAEIYREQYKWFLSKLDQTKKSNNTGLTQSPE